MKRSWSDTIIKKQEEKFEEEHTKRTCSVWGTCLRKKAKTGNVPGRTGRKNRHEQNSDWQNRKGEAKNSRIDTVKKIANALQVNIEELLCEEDEKEQE